MCEWVLEVGKAISSPNTVETDRQAGAVGSTGPAQGFFV